MRIIFLYISELIYRVNLVLLNIITLRNKVMPLGMFIQAPLINGLSILRFQLTYF